jgi:hypothetical protein
MSTFAVPVPMKRGAPLALVALAVGISGSRLRTTGSVTAARWSSLRTPLLKSSCWRCRVPS